MAHVMSQNTHNITDQEWQVRCDLAACYRLFVKFGWTDSIFTHLSARVPGQPEQYLINPYGLLFPEIKASNLIKVDFDGNVNMSCTTISRCPENLEIMSEGWVLALELAEVILKRFTRWTRCACNMYVTCTGGVRDVYA